MRKNLTRKERLKGRANLSRVFAQAAKSDKKGIRLYYIENNLAWNRIAVCPVRGFTSAVARNREKRICREAYRQLKYKLQNGYDLAFVLFPGRYSLTERVRQLEALFERVGLTQ